MDIRTLQILQAYGFLGEVFAKSRHNKVSVDVLELSEVSAPFTLDKEQQDDNVKVLCDDLCSLVDVELCNNRAILTFIADIRQSSDVVLATIFRALSVLGSRLR